VDAEIRDAEVAVGAKVELRRNQETRSARRGIEEHRELLRNEGVISARSRNHVVDALPNLVTPVGAHVAPTLEELFHLLGRWIQNQRAHGRSRVPTQVA
jgi:hypothetical protein